MKNVLYIVTFLCAIAHSDAQIVGDCTPPYDIATSLVDIFVGEGVAYSNVTLSGFECAAGYFDGSNSNIALSSGLVMATDGVGAITPGGGVVTGGGAGVDSDLSLQLQLVNAGATNLNNLIVLEFDFIPTSN